MAKTSPRIVIRIVPSTTPDLAAQQAQRAALLDFARFLVERVPEAAK